MFVTADDDGAVLNMKRPSAADAASASIMDACGRRERVRKGLSLASPRLPPLEDRDNDDNNGEEDAGGATSALPKCCGAGSGPGVPPRSDLVLFLAAIAAEEEARRREISSEESPASAFLATASRSIAAS